MTTSGKNANSGRAAPSAESVEQVLAAVTRAAGDIEISRSLMVAALFEAALTELTLPASTVVARGAKPAGQRRHRVARTIAALSRRLRRFDETQAGAAILIEAVENLLAAPDADERMLPIIDELRDALRPWVSGESASVPWLGKHLDIVAGLVATNARDAWVRVLLDLTLEVEPVAWQRHILDSIVMGRAVALTAHVELGLRTRLAGASAMRVLQSLVGQLGVLPALTADPIPGARPAWPLFAGVDAPAAEVAQWLLGFEAFDAETPTPIGLALQRARAAAEAEGARTARSELDGTLAELRSLREEVEALTALNDELNVSVHALREEAGSTSEVEMSAGPIDAIVQVLIEAQRDKDLSSEMRQRLSYLRDILRIEQVGAPRGSITSPSPELFDVVGVPQPDSNSEPEVHRSAWIRRDASGRVHVLSRGAVLYR